jgi:hypothetical protein
MTELITRPIKRIFTFGCSFTKYYWSTWPEIVSLDLDIPYYNFGKSGGGNQYIANTISQADNIYNFNQDDLIMISWTSVTREDRWVKGNWYNSGNIYTQDLFDKSYVEKWGDPIGYMIRDFASIKLVKNLLEFKGCQHHMMSMCDIQDQLDQGAYNKMPSNVHYDKLCNIYKTELACVHPSFMRTLWNNDIYKFKILPDIETYGTHFSDGHPSPAEHFLYLKTIFPDHKFKEATALAVKLSQENLILFIKEMEKKFRKNWAGHELSYDDNLRLTTTTSIKLSESCQFL